MPQQLFDLNPPPGVAEPDMAEKFLRRTRDAALESGDVLAVVWPTGLDAGSVLSMIFSWFAWEVKAHGLRGLVVQHRVDGTADHAGGTEIYRLFPRQWDHTGSMFEVTFSIYPDRDGPVKIVLGFLIDAAGQVTTSEPVFRWI